MTPSDLGPPVLSFARISFGLHGFSELPITTSIARSAKKGFKLPGCLRMFNYSILPECRGRRCIACYPTEQESLPLSCVAPSSRRSCQFLAGPSPALRESFAGPAPHSCKGPGMSVPEWASSMAVLGPEESPNLARIASQCPKCDCCETLRHTS